MPPTRSARPWLGAVALAGAFAVLGLIGWSRVYDPLVGDQALFLIGAEKLAAGGVLYRDFWDIKQPGVFTFFLAGGRLFGFDQIGEHAADLAWQLAFAGTLVFALRRCFGREAIPLAFVPLAVVGSYYAGSSSWHLLQVEELVGLPLFACTALALAAIRRTSPRLAFASGLCAAAALAFKLLFVIVVLALVGAAVATARAALVRRALAPLALAWLAGLLLPAAIFACYAVAHATVATTLRTTFVIPVQVLLTTEMHAPASRLADSAMRFLLYFRGAIALAAIGFFGVGRTSERARAWRTICGAWIAADGCVIAIQLSSWWQYHFLLLIPPVGILAAFGVAFLVRLGRASVARAAVALAVGGAVAYVAVPLPQGAIAVVERVIRERPFASAGALEAYRIATNGEYADAFADAAPARRFASTASVYVFGDPLIYVDAGTGQAIAMNSWAIQLFTPGLWKRTVRELCERLPDDIFVYDRFVPRLHDGDGGAAMLLLDRAYRRTDRTPGGRWYALAREPGARACGPAVAAATSKSPS